MKKQSKKINCKYCGIELDSKNWLETLLKYKVCKICYDEKKYLLNPTLWVTISKLDSKK